MARRPHGITIKSSHEMRMMFEAGQIIAHAKKCVMEATAPGVETRELDAIAEENIRHLGGVPSFKGYNPGMPYPFPATICASINSEIVHGIPGRRKLRNGDILSVDVGAIYYGMHADSAFTVGIGDISDEARRLIDTTLGSLDKGLAKVRAGARLGDISNAIQRYGEKQGYYIVKKYVGHGIGFQMHEEPQVPNYGKAGRGILLKRGMALAIEPMLNIGTEETEVMPDGWTVATADGSLSAHFEDTVTITADGAIVTTRFGDKRNGFHKETP